MYDRAIIHSSNAEIYVTRSTGEIIEIDYAAMGGDGTEFEDVERFDPVTITDDEMDVLDTGFWTRDGGYVPPEIGWGEARDADPS